MIKMNEEKIKQFELSLKCANEMLEIQGRDGNYNYDSYMLGMYNGMEYIISLFEHREPNYRNGKEIEFLSDKHNKNLLEANERLYQENQRLKEKINTYENPEDLTLMFMYCDEKAKDKIKQLKEKVDYLKNKCENKDKWCQLIADIGYDYDGYRQADSLMKLIDELVKYAIWSRDNYDYDAFQEEGNNE